MSQSNEKHNNIKGLDLVRAMLRGDWKQETVITEKEAIEPPFEDESEALLGEAEDLESPMGDAEPSMVDLEPPLPAEEAPTAIISGETSSEPPPNAALSSWLAAHASPLEAYLATRQSPQSARTMRDRLECVARLLGWPAIGEVPWHRAVGPGTGDRLIAEMMQRSYSPATINLTLAALKGVLLQSWRLGLIDRETLARVTSWGRVNSEGKRGTAGREIVQEELNKLAAYCRSLGPLESEWPRSAYGAMLEAVLALGVGGALRASEICSIPMSGRSSGGKPIGYVAEKQQLRFLAKGNRERVVAIGQAETEVIERWLAVRAELDGVTASTLLVRVYPNGSLGDPQELNRSHIAYLCKLMARGAGIERFSPHDCRRTFGTRGWRQVDSRILQQQMGHASISTTALYDKRGEEEVAQVVRERMDMWPKRVR
jgi:integrase/recombinase XerD